MEFLPLPVTMMTCSIPEATHSSTTYWICGLSTTVNISFGCAFVAGRKRVPRPAAGRTALRTFRYGGFLREGCVGSSVMIGIFVQLPGNFTHRHSICGTRCLSINLRDVCYKGETHSVAPGSLRAELVRGSQTKSFLHHVLA